MYQSKNERSATDKEQEIWANAHEMRKSYSSSCSQIVSLSPAISSQFTLKCAPQPKIAKINKPPTLRLQGLLKSSTLIRLKSSSLVLVVIGSKTMPICNRFHERLAKNGKITNFTGYCSLMPLCAGFLEPRKSRLGQSKSTLNAENFICSTSMSISIDFGAIRSWNVSCSPKSPKNP